MRDLLITLFVIGSLPYILQRPYLGVLMWSWLSYMNPHRMAWGFAYSMPFAQMVALTLMLAVVFSKEKKSIPITPLTTIWIIYILYMGVTSVFAWFPDSAMTYYVRIIKIQLITFMTLMLITDLQKLRLLIWVIVGSIGFYSIKGGVFTILTAGSFRVWGAPESFIEDNNSLAVATLMIIPLMVYLYQTSKNKWLRYGLIFGITMSFASALGSQSRGALLAILAVSGFFWLKSNHKAGIGIAIVIMLVVGFQFMPDSWHERMSTIQEYEQDKSAMGRINAWTYAVNGASDRLFGMGLESWSHETFALYAPDPNAVHAAHSIYFSVLADHGWPGLFMFLIILLLTWLNLGKVIKYCRNREGEDYHEYDTMARMIQISMIAYMSGGAFLSLSYFDLPWHLICFFVLIRHQMEEKLKQPPANSASSALPA